MKKIISGKVREVYDLEDGRMVIVTTDRISAFDVILPTMITDKGKVLNALSNFWFELTKDITKNHMISSNLKDMPSEFQKPEYEGRTILVKKLKMIPYEVIVRGYMFGSMYEAYKKGEVMASDSVRTSGEAVSAVTELDYEGQGMIYYNAWLVDKDGFRVPTGDNMVRFEVSGPAELLATDAGDPTSHASFRSDSIRCFSGAASAILRRKGKGRVAVKAVLL